jgi:hypothetical protein
MSPENTYQVRFKLRPDPSHTGGYILQYERVGDITHVDSPLKAVFRSLVQIEGAFLKAGLYLHSYGQADEERDVRPDPEQDYEVTNKMMRDLGFDIPG